MVPQMYHRGRHMLVLVSLGTLALIGLGIALGVLLLPSCGINPVVPALSRWLETCPQASGVLHGLEQEANLSDALRDRIARLERELAGLPACSPPAPSLARPEEPLVSDVPLLAPEPEEPLPEPEEPLPEPEEPLPEPEEPLPEPEEPLSEHQPEEPDEREEPSEFDERLEAEDGEVSEELTVTLIWDDRSDLDLEVHCPGGGTAGIRGTGCGGGVLDVDANGYGSSGLRMMERPVENVRFGGNAPEGTYRIRIFISHGYENALEDDRRRNSGHHSFSVRVISRESERIFEGVHPGLGGSDVWFSFSH